MNKKNRKRYLMIIIGIIVVLAVVGAIIFIMSKSINKSVYEERKEFLDIITDTAATTVNEDISMEWEIADLVVDLTEYNLTKTKNAEAAIEEVKNELDIEGEYFFLVDDTGKYFSSDGHYGKLTDLTYYTDLYGEKTEYLSTLPHMDQEETFLIFRAKLENPVSVATEYGDANITYISYAYDITALSQKIAGLFQGATNVFVYDSNGAMLYKNFGIRLLIEGYNIYPKFSAASLPFGEDPDTLIEMCKNKEDVVIDMIIDGSEFYFCSAPLDVSDWSLAFVVQEQYLGGLNENSFSNIILYVALIAIVLGAALIFGLYMSMRNKATGYLLQESRELAEALSEASNAKTDFLSNMSHDIRTPINGIMGMTKIALKSKGNPDKVEDCLHKIDGASHHLLSLINDVLDMSRIEKGKTTIKNDHTDIRLICDNCASIIRGQIGERKLEFVTSMSVKHTRVLADELHMRQILINILGNAVKFTKDGGRIDFICTETECDNDNVKYQIVVKDNGIGMSKKFKEHIFEAFSQEENSSRTKYKGTGLGMSITKQLVDLMNGDIQVESEAGKGSVFTVTLTFALDKEKMNENAKPMNDVNIQGLKILLAEDNDLNMEIAKELLEDAGAIIDPALDGQEALDKFAGSPPGTYDVILMDIMMPKMNGIEATKAIRSLDREDALSIPILAMTANAFDDDVRATREAGMNAHLSKPINVDEVIKNIAFFSAK